MESCRSRPQRDLGGVQLIPALLARLSLANPRQVDSEWIYNTSGAGGGGGAGGSLAACSPQC